MLPHAALKIIGNTRVESLGTIGDDVHVINSADAVHSSFAPGTAVAALPSTQDDKSWRDRK